MRVAYISLGVVLPPIPTTGLTSADVAALAVKVHDLMVETLREISQPPPPGMEPKSAQPAVSPSPLASTPSPTPPQQQQPEQPKPAVAEPEHARTESRASTNTSENSVTSSPVLTHSRMEGSEYGTETDEDDGMVLVGRPSRS